MSDTKILGLDKKALTFLSSKRPPKVMQWSSPTYERPPAMANNTASLKIEEEKVPDSYPLKRKETLRSELNWIIIDIDPKVWKKNKGNWVPIIPYRGQKDDEHLLYLVKYIKWLFRIGKWNSKSSESGSISSLSLYRNRSSFLNKSNVSDKIENPVDAWLTKLNSQTRKKYCRIDTELSEKLSIDFKELYCA